MKKDYTPIEMTPTDKRYFGLRYEGKKEFLELGFSQLDFLQIMTYLNGKNDRLYNKIKFFIEKVDADSGLKTDFDRQLPRRRVHGKF